jgi:DNA-binding transcriptional ArsR family regulator
LRRRKLHLTQLQTVDVFKALASETRTRILTALSESPMNVSALSDLLGISQSATTKHVQQLAEADLIAFEHRPGTQGTQKVCRLRDDVLNVFLAPAAAAANEGADVLISGDEVIQAAGVTTLPPEVEGTIRAEDNPIPTQIIFVNNTSTPYERYWLNWVGEREDYGTVMPSTVVSQMTWARHAWLLAAVEGDAVGIFITGSHVGCVVIGPSGVSRPAWLDDMTRQPESEILPDPIAAGAASA